MNESLLSLLAVSIVSYSIAMKIYLTHLIIPNERLKVIESKLKPIFSKFASNLISI